MRSAGSVEKAWLDHSGSRLTVQSLGEAGVRARLSGNGLVLQTGLFRQRLLADVPALAPAISLLYADYPVLDNECYCDFTLSLRRPANLRRWVKPQVLAYFDGQPLFEPLPLGHAFPLLEWGLNFCATTSSFDHLTAHAAVLERGGRAVILPAPSGSGKSTLCAALLHRGWRLLSDELTVIDLDARRVWPVARPVSLKNRSIDIIRAFAPEAVFCDPTHDTTKGTVAHMRVPSAHLVRMNEPAVPAWIVFPRWVADAPAELTPRDKAETVLDFAQNSFNGPQLGLDGFRAMTALIDRCDCLDFVYGRLDDAVRVFEHLAAA